MKLLVIFFFLFLVSSSSYQKGHLKVLETRSDSLNTVFYSSETGLIQTIKDKFNSFGAKLETCKFCNFMLGAVLKIFSLLEGNTILDIVKCVVNSVETYYNAVKFPQKSLDELKDLAKKNEDETKNQLEAGEKNVENSDDLKEMDDYEKSTRKLECSSNEELMKESDGLNFIENVDPNEDHSEELELTSSLQKFAQISNEKKLIKKKKFNPKKLFKKLKSKFSVLKDKFKHLIEKMKEKLLKLEATVKAWLNKPTSKALISFVECAAAPILKLVLSGGISFAKFITGVQLIEIVSQAPKFLKMIIDGIKHLRVGWLKTNIKEKYMEYGKGTANLLALIILSAIPK